MNDGQNLFPFTYFRRTKIRGLDHALALRRHKELVRILDGPVGQFAVDIIQDAEDRKSTRLNSSHQIISYAVFCLKKKKKKDRSDELMPAELLTVQVSYNSHRH